jgi:hypothetical protein
VANFLAFARPHVEGEVMTRQVQDETMFSVFRLDDRKVRRFWSRPLVGP